MKRVLAMAGLLCFLVFPAAFASATTTTLYFTGGTSGVVHNGVYMGPYDFYVGASHSITKLVCASASNEITTGETWTVDVLGITSMNNVWGRTKEQWDEAAWLASQLLASPGNYTIQEQIWYIMGLGGQDNSSLDTAWNNYYGSTSFRWTSDTFYIPDPASQTWNNQLPQPFIGTPEPASLMLLGSGLLGIAALKRKRNG